MLQRLARLFHPTTIFALFFAFIFIALATTQQAHSSIFSYTDNKQEQTVADEKAEASPSDGSEDKGASYSDGYSTSASDTSSLQSNIPGVGAFFGNMLDSLSSLSNSSEGRFSALAESFPLVFPDLYKVFITL